MENFATQQRTRSYVVAGSRPASVSSFELHRLFIVWLGVNTIWPQSWSGRPVGRRRQGSKGLYEESNLRFAHLSGISTLPIGRTANGICFAEKGGACVRVCIGKGFPSNLFDGWNIFADDVEMLLLLRKVSQ